MYCLKKRCFVLGFLIASFVVAMFPQSAFADYSSVYLSPSSGTIYSDYSVIQVKVNSGSDEFVGVDLDLSFTGNVSYVTSTGASRCSSFRVTPGTATINIECISIEQSEGETYNGTVATLYFKSTGTGSSTFTFTSNDPEITSVTGGTYTLSTAKNPAGGGLPQSGLFDSTTSVIVLGSVLILFGIFFKQINSTAQLAWNKMGEGIVNMRTNSKENRDKKRKEKFEKEF